MHRVRSRNLCYVSQSKHHDILASERVGLIYCRLKGVPMPPKLKCSRCDKYKGHTAFSEKQLNDARMSFRNRTTYNIRCGPCNGGQLVEIECCYCGKTKGLDEFAKSQRTKPDSAVCSSLDWSTYIIC
jgi:hypothetical protein